MSSAAFALVEKTGAAKSAQAFRTISEVANELDMPQHVLRFWESRFAQIRPVKRAGGRRYYRPDDIDLLKGIRALLYSDGFTIKGVQKVLKERGIRHVADIGRGGATSPSGRQSAPEPLVIEKIVYVEKPAVKKRVPHLRAVPSTPSLPFFDDGAAGPDLSVPDRPPPPLAPITALEAAYATSASEAAMMDRLRLEELLDELTGLKDRLRAARMAA
ncbi:MAG TPA: MerR family transcriptional regulator [Rhizomicrobium sp.]|jgi:DNA-binding transcriptional MerR regulator|nr:MerR family transcriptional regulator [Rhizomicrobium sp.]